ncbi:MAG: quinolinate synthase NadA [Planctomycetes bacterium]|nr:quinolinate synthase NadA [Planctomycetota bacterium]
MPTAELTVAVEPVDFEAFRQLENDELEGRIRAAKQELGDELLILGHHYQQDEVIQFADLTGDSYRLSALAAQTDRCRSIVFCGVHFMAETADILANARHSPLSTHQSRVTVILPDLNAGCSMADMADIDQVEDCWSQLGEVIDTEDVMPVTYINSAANLKAFCGEHGGIVCTSSNAAAVLQWSFQRRGRVLFFPDQHLGRNTAKRMGIPLDEMLVWDPHQPLGGNPDQAIEHSRVLLWRGHCSVHQMFKPEHVTLFRQRVPGIKVLVHPECMMQVVDMADLVGSTEYILRTVREAPPGSKWAIGTELHLVNRLKNQHPDQEIHFLSPMVCMCATMYRIDLTHLCWSLENLVQGTAVNVIRVPDDVAHWALMALERMLAVK